MFAGTLVLACIALTVFQVGDRIQWYIKHPITVDIEQIKLQSVTFPTVLLCPGTQYRCSWLDGETCDITEAVGEPGRCVKVSPPSNLSTVQNSDATYSLDMLLSLEHYYGIPGINIDPEKIQLYLIPPDEASHEHVISSSNKFTIASGKHHGIAVTQINEIKRHSSNCGDEQQLKYGDIYTNLNCMLDNRADRLTQICGCKPKINTIFETKLPQDTHLCSFIEELKCLNKRNHMKIGGKIDNKSCLNDCHSVAYEVDLSLESLDTSALPALLPSNWSSVRGPLCSDAPYGEFDPSCHVVGHMNFKSLATAIVVILYNMTEEERVEVQKLGCEVNRKESSINYVTRSQAWNQLNTFFNLYVLRGYYITSELPFLTTELYGAINSMDTDNETRTSFLRLYPHIHDILQNWGSLQPLVNWLKEKEKCFQLYNNTFHNDKFLRFVKFLETQGHQVKWIDEFVLLLKDVQKFYPGPEYDK